MPTGNPNHSKENGQFTSGSGSGGHNTVTHEADGTPRSASSQAWIKGKSGEHGPSKATSPSMSDVFSGKTKYNEKTDTHHEVDKRIDNPPSAVTEAMNNNKQNTEAGKKTNPALSALRHHVTGAIERGEKEAIVEQKPEQKYKSELATEQGRKNHRSIAEAFNNGQSKKIGNYHTDGKAIYLHGNKIVEKGPNGEINFTLAGWPTNTTRSSLRDFGINVSTKGGKQNYTHSGGTEEIDSNTMYRAKDEQPDMALDPNSAAVNSPVPWKGRNLDNDPVGDRSATPDVGSGSAGATWNGRTLD